MAWAWLFDGDESPRQFETRKQLAHALGVSSTTVKAWLAKGLDGDRALGEWRSSEQLIGKSVYWLHDGDDEPTCYGSYSELATKLGVTRGAVSHYVRRGIDGDESRRQAQNARKGFTARSYNQKAFVYQGRNYASIVEFQQVNQCGYKLAKRAMKGEDITSVLLGVKHYAISPEFLAKMEQAQALAKRALGRAK